MVTFIPPYMGEEIKSNAEKKLFYKLQDMEDTDDWTVLHSVGIANHPTQSQGEADFVVVIPGGGIFVLEVKGGRISYHDGSTILLHYRSYRKAPNYLDSFSQHHGQILRNYY